MTDRIQEAAEVIAAVPHLTWEIRTVENEHGHPETIGAQRSAAEVAQLAAQALADAGLLRDEEPTGPFHWRIPHGRLSEQGYPTYEEAMDAAARSGFLTIAQVVKMPAGAP